MPGFDQAKQRMVIPALCPACKGSAVHEGFAEQEEEKFTNAYLSNARALYAVLGPIREFRISDFNVRSTRIFDVTPDQLGDLAVLLVPVASGVMRSATAKAYLVGGVVRERMTSAGTRK